MEKEVGVGVSGVLVMGSSVGISCAGDGFDGNLDQLGIGEFEGKWRSEDEKKRLQLMRVVVEREDPSSKEADEILRRFLRARDLNVDKASEMFIKYLRWRRTDVPHGFVSKSDIQNELDQKKLFSQGFDKKGHPIGVILGGRHVYAKRDLNEFKRLCVYTLDKICSRIPSDKEKFTFIADVEGWRYANCDIRAYLSALEITQNYYPERLNKVFLVHVPYLFMKAWKVIYPFIDKNTRKKYIFVDDNKLKETLLQDIEESQLPDIYGGKLSLVPVEDV